MAQAAVWGERDHFFCHFDQMNARELRPNAVAPELPTYAAAHEGSQPASTEQMTSYASTPEQQSALQKLIELQKERVSFVSPTRHLIQQPANGGK